MEALLQAIAAKYGFEYAAKLLGLDQQTQNPKYAISMGGKTFDVGNMFKRAGLNEGIKTITGGSSMGMAIPLAGSLGLAYLRNPLRQGSMNYNPYLKDQMTYLSGKNMLGTDQSGLTKYGPDSILSGQNVVSMFGTNNYLDQLNNYKNKYGKTMPKNRLDKLNKEIADYELDQVNKELKADAFKTLQNINADNNGGGGSGTNNAQHGSSGMSKSQHSAFRAARGGIASL